MHNAIRGVRNIARNKVRTLTVALLIGAIICLSITMMAINVAVEAQVQTVEASVGNLVEIRPAGTFGGFGRAEPMAASVLEGMSGVPNVLEVAPMVVFQQMRRPSPAEMRDPAAVAALIRERMAVMGIVPGQSLRLMGGGTAEITAGRTFSADDAGQAVAVVGSAVAENRSLELGGVVTVNGVDMTVIGIATAGNQFGDGSVFLPLGTAQRVLEMTDQISQIYVKVNALPNVAGVVAALKEMVGDSADVVSQGEMMLERVGQAMDLVRGTTSTGLWLALGAAGLVICATMFLIIRERQKEIGVLKALGASSSDLLSGFAWESVTLAAIGALVGVLLFLTVGQQLATTVLAQAVPQAPRITGGAMQGGMQGLRGMGQMMLRGGGWQAQLGGLSVSLSGALLLRALGAALGLGLLGGLLPALFALRLKPAEVLRNE
ncbi:MAG: Lipoprotein-releasing system transmembrane protein LolE [Firmicutes bacterium]|nr:Lipoprotein-releasing system transmembrane protein LolE [candidate division NPL-UPA2 bacterium]